MDHEYVLIVSPEIHISTQISKLEHRILQIPLLVRLPDTDPLVIFHNRYWGKTICPEHFVTIGGHRHEYIIVDEPAYGPTSGRLLILSQYPILYARIQDHMRTLTWSGVIVQGSPGIGMPLLLISFVLS